MAGRRLSELLEEQQEPFLLLHQEARKAAPQCRSIAEAHRRHRVYVSKNGDAAAGRRSALGRAARRAVRLAGCFSCGARGSFRRLPRARSTGGSHRDDDDDGGGRRLSPVSVLDVLRYCSDEESSSHALSSWEEDNDKPSSTLGSSPPSDLQNDLLAAGAISPPSAPHTTDDWTRARSAEEALTRGSGKKKKSTEEQKIISSWERIAGDIARVPVLAELDLSSTGSAPEWRRLGLGEAAWVGASIEAMIFEEVRVEAVRDMLILPA